MDRRIGAQLYTTRNQMKTIGEFEEGIKKLKGFGYQVVQISGIPLPAKELKQVLDAYGMECAFTHRAFQDFQKDLSEISEDLTLAAVLDTGMDGIGYLDRILSMPAYSIAVFTIE